VPFREALHAAMDKRSDLPFLNSTMLKKLEVSFMKANLSKLCITFLILVFASCSPVLIGSKKTKINIIPRPVSVNILDGSFVIDAETEILIDTPDSELNLIANKLMQKINAVSSFQLSSSVATPFGKKSIVLLIDESLKELGEEGYQLTVLPRRSCGLPAV